MVGGELPSAIEHFERAAAMGSLSLNGQIALGEAYAGSGDDRIAIEIWERSLQSQEPSPELLTRLLEAHRRLGDYPSAINVLEQLASLRPTDVALRYQLGLMLATQQPDAALAHLTQAAELDPSLEGDTQVLIDAIRSGSLSGEPAQTLFEAGRALASLGEWQLSAEAFSHATRLRPDFADAWAFWGEARQHLAENISLQPVPYELDRALRIDPNSLSANTLMALYWRRQGRFDRALEYLRTVTALYPENPALQVELGETLALEGEPQAAILAYQQAAALAPQDPAYQRSLAGFCIRNEYEVRLTGLPAARRAVILDPQDPENLDTLGQVLVLLGDLASAERNFLRAIQLQADHAPAHLHLGLVYALQGERQLAYQEWQMVLSLAPGTAYADQTERLIENYFP